MPLLKVLLKIFIILNHFGYIYAACKAEIGCKKYANIAKSRYYPSSKSYKYFLGYWLNTSIDTDSSKLPSTLAAEAVCLKFIPQPINPIAMDLWFYCRVREFEELKCGQAEYGPLAINRSMTESRYSWSSLRKWTDLTDILKQPYLHGCETFVIPDRSKYLWVMDEKLTGLRVDVKFREFQETQFAANSSQLEQCLCNVHCSYAVLCNFSVDTVLEEAHLKDNSSLFIILLITAICLCLIIFLIYLSGKDAPIHPVSRPNSVIFVREYVNNKMNM